MCRNNYKCRRFHGTFVHGIVEGRRFDWDHLPTQADWVIAARKGIQRGELQHGA